MPEQITSWGEGWLWLGGSLLLAVLWANLTWYFRKPRPGRISELVARLSSWHLSPLLLQFLRLLYYIGLPAAAFYLGHDAIVQRYLGLSDEQSDVWLRWAYDVGWAAVVGIGAWTVMALGWRAYRHALHTAGKESTIAGTRASGWVFLREAAYHEVHWAFYRNAPIVALKQLTGDTYWGVWIGLALVALEAALNPAWRKSLGDPEKAPARLMRGALAVVSSTFFVQTQDGNLLLSIVLHFCVSWGLAALTRVFPPLPAHKHDQAQARS